MPLEYPDTRYSYSLLVLQGLRQEACLKFYKNRVESQFFCAEGISGEDALKSRDRCNVCAYSVMYFVHFSAKTMLIKNIIYK